MNFPHFNQRGQSRADVIIDLMRVCLGVGLFLKGVDLMEHRDSMVKLLEESGSWVIVPVAVIHYVIPVYFAGGILLALGLITRLAVLAQIPILLGALFYAYLPELVIIEGRQNPAVTSLVLLWVMLILIHGSGRWSVDYLLEKTESAHVPTTATA